MRAGFIVVTGLTRSLAGALLVWAVVAAPVAAQPSPAPPTGVLGSRLAPSSTSAPWKIAVEPNPNIIGNYPATMRIRISDAKGQPVTGAAVEFHVTMIDMDHGDQKVSASMVAPGVYEGKVTYYMIGAWTLEVRAKRGNEAMSHKERMDIKR